jgi:hypothetical protein
VTNVSERAHCTSRIDQGDSRTLRMALSRAAACAAVTSARRWNALDITVATTPRPPITMFCLIMLACSLCTQLLNGRQSAVWQGMEERWPKGDRIWKKNHDGRVFQSCDSQKNNAHDLISSID